MNRIVAGLVALLLAGAVIAQGSARIGDVPLAALPQEARATLEQIKSGAKFAHPKDGSTFGNREKLLPPRKYGYYREYTVRTPGARDRGARRIVAGGSAGEYYYSDDHYNSFRRIRE
jgi:ribonuclease T1